MFLNKANFMKTCCFKLIIAVFLFHFSNGIQAQTTQTKLDQVELIQDWVGTWQRVIGNDSILVLEFQQYGKGFKQDLYLLTNGKKSIQGIACYSFSAKDDKFKVFSLTADGNYLTGIVYFTTEKKWDQYLVQDFNPEKILLKGEGELVTPNIYTSTWFDSNGVKTAEGKWTKIK
jgi:hypothetical protein